MSEGVLFESPFHSQWRPIGGDIEVLIDDLDPAGVIHVRRGGREEVLTIPLATPIGGPHDWTLVSDDVEVQIPAHARAGSIRIRHRAH